MWDAIKSDLFDFVSTITEDTTKTINIVLGDKEDEDQPEVTLQQKLIADLRRSYETYSTPIKQSDQRDYDRFKKKFNLSSLTEDIASVLDEEPEISRFYTELVPLTIPPDEFWARLYFRINQLFRNASTSLVDDDDEEEELVWEDEHPAHRTDNDAKAEGHDDQCGDVDSSSTVGAEQSSGIIDVSTYIGKRVIQLEKENQMLRLREDELSRRLAELETVLLSNGISIAPTNQPIEVHSDDSSGPKSRTSEESIVFVDKSDAIISSKVTPLKVDILASGSYRAEAIHAFAATIDTPVVEGYYTPVESRIDDIDVDVRQDAPKDVETVDLIKGDNGNERGYSKVERNLLRGDGSKKSNPDKYLASLDDEDDEDGWN